MTEPSSPAPAPSSHGRPGRGNRQVVGPFTLRHLATLGAAVLGVAVVLIVLTLPLGKPAATAAPTPGSSFFVIGDVTTGLQVGQLAPELTGTVDGKTVGLTDLDGKPIRLADLRGRPVWISFWATWCPPCQQETPVLRAVYDTHKAQGLALLAISVQETTPEDVRQYVTTYGLDATIGFDGTSAVFKTYLAYGLPTHLFLDRAGIIRAIHLGPLTQIEAEQILAPLLAN
jgi:cytochrome c biogenesis protein CcmG, thiol:disulfide interchange protein DsbE